MNRQAILQAVISTAVVLSIPSGSLRLPKGVHHSALHTSALLTKAGSDDQALSQVLSSQPPSILPATGNGGLEIATDMDSYRKLMRNTERDIT